MIVGAVMCIFKPPDTVTKAGPPPPSIVGSRDTYRSKIQRLVLKILDFLHHQMSIFSSNEQPCL